MTKALFGKWAPGHPLRLVQKKEANNCGVPFCLTEEFAAVYRLHPLCPPGVVIERSSNEGEFQVKTEFIPFRKLCGTEGRDILRVSSHMPRDMMKSMYAYPWYVVCTRIWYCAVCYVLCMIWFVGWLN